MDCITYSNFEEFKEAHPALADELLKEVSEGAWQNEELYWYKTLGDFCTIRTRRRCVLFL